MISVLLNPFDKITTFRVLKIIITKYLACVIGNKCMHINIFISSIYQARVSIYKYLQIIKYAKKDILNDYLQNIISSISRLQDKSSEVVESNIQHNSRDISS